MLGRTFKHVAFSPACLVLALLSVFSPQIWSADKPARDPLEVRIVGRGGTILLSRGGHILALAQIRKVLLDGEDPILDLPKEWARLKPIEINKESLRQVAFSEISPTQVKVDGSVLLRARRMADGLRVLVSPEVFRTVKAGNAQSEEQKPGVALPLELVIEIFPHPKHEGALPKRVPSRRGLRGVLGADADHWKKKGPEHETLRALQLSFEGPSDWRVEVARSGPTEWTIERPKKNKKNKKKVKRLLIRSRLQPDPRTSSKPGAFVFYLGEKWDVAEPEASPLYLNKRRTPAGDFVEGALRVYAGGADPFAFEDLSVFAEIAFPAVGAGEPRVVMLPCYFWEGPSWAKAEGEFRFRFAPPFPGVYGVRTVIISRSATVRSGAVAIQAGPRASHGFVRADEKKRVLRFDDGRIFMPVGLNLAWPSKSREYAEYKERFRRLARNGGNATRIWLSSWGLPLEQERAGVFDADVAEGLDLILSAAQARGIHVILAAENAYDLTSLSKQHPYFLERGGPLSVSAEFFRNVDALKYYRRRLTYLAARYGAYRSLLAWELMNEADEAWLAIKFDPDAAGTPAVEADRARLARRALMKWIKLMSGHLKGMDPHGHPVSLSVALPPELPWKKFEVEGDVQLIQAHGYIPEAQNAVHDLAFDAAGLIESWAVASRSVGRSHRPYLLGEFGFRSSGDQTWKAMAPEERAKERSERDAEGLLLHNGMMAGLASGMAGAPFFWWWDRYVEKHDLWKLFKGPSLFAEALTRLATREGPETLRSISNRDEADSAVRVVGRAGSYGMCVWIQDRRSTWARKLEHNDAVPPSIKGLSVKLPALKPGTYEVVWLDVWKGAPLQKQDLDVKAVPAGEAPRPLKLSCPPFRRDVAVMVEMKNGAALPQTK